MELRPKPTPFAIDFGGCPTPAILGTLGLLFTGSSGSGKTSAKNLALREAYSSLGKPGSPWSQALAHDFKGTLPRTLIQMGVRPEQIVVINPARIDTAVPDMSDFAGDAGAFELARGLSPVDDGSPDRFWTAMTGSGVDATANSFNRTAPGRWYLDDLLYTMSSQELFQLVAGLFEGNRPLLEPLYGHDMDRTRAGVFLSIQAIEKQLRVCAAQFQAARKRGNRMFSFRRDWMYAPGTIVVLQFAPSHSESWPTLMKVLLTAAIRAFKSETRHVSGTDPRAWSLSLFDLDEYPQLELDERRQQDFFLTGRELGAVPVVGIQNITFVRSRGILSNLSLEMHGVTGCAETARFASEHFGQHELRRETRNLDSDGGVTGAHEQVFQEPRVPPDQLMRENRPGCLRFYAKVPGIGKWEYELRIKDLARIFPLPSREEVDDERERLRAPQAEFTGWSEEDFVRLGLTRSLGSNELPFLNPNVGGN